MDKSVKLFYTPPKDESFEELREICIRFWRSFTLPHMWDERQEQLEIEYVQSKINEIKDLKNEGSNFVSMVQMIHQNSREVLAKSLSLETRNEISMRLYGWEKENEFDPFNIWNIDNNLNEKL
jgi:hypothetical protein